MRFKGLLIDLDGTLLDTLPDIHAAGNLMLADLGMTSMSLEQASAYVGKGAEVFVRRSLAKQLDGEPNPPGLEKALPLFYKHYAVTNGAYVKSFPFVREGLTVLRDAGVLMACVTNKPQALSVEILRKNNLLTYFSFVQGGDLLAEKKPSAVPMLWASSRLGLPTSACAVLGDSANDMDAAKAAGMFGMLLPYGYREGRTVDSIHCDAQVSNLAEAAQLVLSSLI